jgi:hypothetical protein
LPTTAFDSITPAVEHTTQQLFRPFRIGQWTKLAFVGLLAGELGANGCNRSNFHIPRHAGPMPHMAWPGSMGIDHTLLVLLIAAMVLAALSIGIILMYVGSVMRFVLFDSIIARECHIRWSWSRRLGPGWRYFVWKLLFIFVTLAMFLTLVVVPLAFAFTAGWFREPKEHLPVLALGGIFLFFVVFALFVAAAVVLVLTKDFVIPQMALEDVDAMEGWRRLWRMMKADTGSYAAYIAMKILLAIIAGILIGVATIILGLMIAVPSAAFGILAVLTGKAAGLTWNAGTVALAVTIGLTVLAGFLYLVSLVAVPAIVFFPAYSIYFFASRYPRLGAVLYAQPPASQAPPSAAPAPA